MAKTNRDNIRLKNGKLLMVLNLMTQCRIMEETEAMLALI